MIWLKPKVIKLISGSGSVSYDHLIKTKMNQQIKVEQERNWDSVRNLGENIFYDLEVAMQNKLTSKIRFVASGRSQVIIKYYLYISKITS